MPLHLVRDLRAEEAVGEHLEHQRLDPLAEIFPRVIDGLVGAVLAADRQLAVGRAAGDAGAGLAFGMAAVMAGKNAAEAVLDQPGRAIGAAEAMAAAAASLTALQQPLVSLKI